MSASRVASGERPFHGELEKGLAKAQRSEDSLVFTAAGLLPIGELVGDQETWQVSDGTQAREIYDSHVLSERTTYTVRTRRGLVLTGSENHRIQDAGGLWRRLDRLSIGEEVRLGAGAGLWAKSHAPVTWRPKLRISSGDDAKENQSLTQSHNRRTAIRIPASVDERLASFLGDLVGDWHISRAKRHLGWTSGELPQAERFAQLGRDLFGLKPALKQDEGRWRVLFHSEMLSDLLVEGLGLTQGKSAPFKRVPVSILRSPGPVVASFLQSLFDADGYAGTQGVILRTSSEELGHQVQLLLLNFGILSRRR